jgi:hypothetical protein
MKVDQMGLWKISPKNVAQYILVKLMHNFSCVSKNGGYLCKFLKTTQSKQSPIWTFRPIWSLCTRACTAFRHVFVKWWNKSDRIQKPDATHSSFSTL